MSDPNGPTLADDSPLSLALAYMRDRRFGRHPGDWEPEASLEDAARLRHWRGDFYSFEHCVYRRLVGEDLEADVTRFLNTVNVERTSRGVSYTRRLRVTGNTVREAMRQMKAVCQAPVACMPSWLDADAGSDRPGPRDVIAFQNGLIDVARWVRGGQPEPDRSTPLWFSESVLPCVYDPAGKCPKWEKFLQQSLEGDEELIGLLQEWLGYCLTGDTGRQKMLWLYGRSGAGKSTFTKVLTHVVGERNSVSFQLFLLPNRFTLSSFLGKTLAVSHDTHLGRGTDLDTVLAYVKGIVGEDDQLIDRKNRELLSGIRLTTRLVVVTNQLPSLPDSGDTLRRRSLIVPFEKPFTGQENLALAGELMGEAAGIAQWGLAGYRRLCERGSFPKTVKGTEVQDRLSRLSSPIISFLEECCELPPPGAGDDVRSAFRVEKDAAHRAYCHWWAENRKRDPMHKDRFAEAIYDNVGGARAFRPRDPNDRTKRLNMMEGLRLTAEVAAWVERAELSKPGGIWSG